MNILPYHRLRREPKRRRCRRTPNGAALFGLKDYLADGFADLMPLTVHVRAYEELNDFLPSEKRKRTFPYSLGQDGTVRDLLAALGIPDTRVDLVLADGDSVGFSHVLREGARVSIYPVFEALDISPLALLRPKPLRETRFLAGHELKGLARYLRLLGFDTLWEEAWCVQEIVRVAEKDRRVLLTRDAKLARHRGLSRVFRVHQTKPGHQLLEVLRRLDLCGSAVTPGRCPECNGLFEATTSRDQVWYCVQCGTACREGIHLRRVRTFVDRIVQMIGADARPGSSQGRHQT